MKNPRLPTDLYHRLHRLSWTGLALFCFGLYVVLCSGFGVLYYVLAGAVDGADPNSFLDHLWFSVQTVSTIGYGGMQPVTPAAHSLVALESFLGLIGFALMTGLFFSKFSRATAKVRFSDVAVVREINGESTLKLRLANERSTGITEADVSVYAIRDETTAEGEEIRRFYSLELERHTTPVFQYSFTVRHRLDSNSPISELNPNNVDNQLVSLVVTFRGTDDALVSDVHDRHAYSPDDIRFDHRFVDILDLDGAGPPSNLNIEKISDTQRLPRE